MPHPKVSIIVPVYNVEKYLERCVNSLRSQTLADIEIILVDDSSTDSSPKLCDIYAAEDSRVKVIHKVNEGAGMARNAALKLALGEYIGFADSDDYVEPEMFETLYKRALKYNSDLVMSGVLFVDGNMFSKEGERICKSYFDVDTQFDTPESIKELRMGIIGSKPGDFDDSKYGMSVWKNLFRSELIRKNGIEFQSEREMLSEDSLFMVDFIACIERATGIPEAFYNYCRNANSISKSYKADRLEKSLRFVNEVEKRFMNDIEPDEYRIYIDRFWQAMCRVICCQEIMHAVANKIPYSDLKKRLRAVCENDLTIGALKSYPINTLPLKQKIFAYCMKYRMYLLLKVLVILRSN